MAIDTAKVEGRRTLHFSTIQDIVNDVEQLSRGKFTPLGNWSGGQVLKHLSTVMLFSLDGANVQLPWYLRIVGRVMRGRVLSKGMTPGFIMKGPMAEQIMPKETSWEEGLQMFREMTSRLQKEPQRKPSPFFGEMSKEDWERLHCRHSELHLSFLVPTPG